MSDIRQPYVGPRRRLVLAFDVGTTYSGISYSILDPGHVPEIKGVTRFPAHEQISGASKIPTIIYYDKGGNVCAVGAEAMREGIYEQAEDEDWVKSEWFKLHIRPKTDSSRQITAQIPPLPLNKSVIDVMADFLGYLFKCASTFIQDTHANGRDLWESVQGEIDFVLSHPNGWEGFQQTQMREAIVKAGLIEDTRKGHSRVSFVTEGEASLHFSIDNGLPARAMDKGDGVAIVDAGGGTIDVSVYSRYQGNDGEPATFKEIAPPQCHFQGSVFVSIHAKVFLEAFLGESDFLEDLDHIVRCFDKTTKVRFSSDKQPQYIKFGSTRDNDASCSIRFGQLKLAGEDVATFFEGSVKCIVEAVQEMKRISHKPIRHVVLVGGFAANDWLFNRVEAQLKEAEIVVSRPENHVNKAVSDGAISFYLDHKVTSRVAKFTYGQFRTAFYDEADPEHRARRGKTFMCASGEKLVPDFFAILLSKNTQVKEGKEFRQGFGLRSENKSDIQHVSSSVWAYRGKNLNPRWKDVDPDLYTKLCSIEMDLSHIPLTPRAKAGGVGLFYYLGYDLVLSLSSVEMTAQIAWEENGFEKRSPAKIIYDPDITED
ncbi:hypothetical protein FA15DRAFT_667159 [Coprinopsis marcescibilis]|uniref:Actin-like ATPase domain-containing protein n=1 Tax=Coprinopsis marcescibilis TaxID=230819 RepID=A0A5C3L161_COPMA|nr:hypothetical protein FA15DRAFT_667159 [Coprinopsis marcescibilis]